MEKIKFPEIAQKIIELQNADFQLRQLLIEKGILSKGYHPDMEALHLDNADQLEAIIDEIGYPTKHKLGNEANEAAWIIIQHSISRPSFMRKCAQMFSQEVDQQHAEAQHLAYLQDRIAVLEGKPQRFGTQFDWDSDGKLMPNVYDDIQKVNERRKKIGLESLEKQIIMMQLQAEKENQSAPEDYFSHQKEYEKWRKKVGWIE